MQSGFVELKNLELQTYDIPLIMARILKVSFVKANGPLNAPQCRVSIHHPQLEPHGAVLGGLAQFKGSLTH